MQADSEIARILNTVTVGQTVTVKYTIRGGGPNRPFERWINITVNRVGETIYGTAFSAQYGTSDVHITTHGQNVIRINYDGWHVITGADSPFVK